MIILEGPQDLASKLVKTFYFKLICDREATTNCAAYTAYTKKVFTVLSKESELLLPLARLFLNQNQ